MPDRGRFITFEGAEGCGKTTHAASLASRLEGEGIAVLLVREPGGTATGEAVREILQHHGAGEPIRPETELFLFEACRAQLVRDRIVPALEAGRWVVCDRFADSTLAYQGYGRGLDLEQLAMLNRIAAGGLEPDLTFVLDISPEDGLNRVAARKSASGNARRDRFEDENAGFHERVRNGFLDLARRSNGRLVVVPSDRAAEEVDRDIWNAVRALFPRRSAGGRAS
jgi:dTMP kinase